MKKLKHLLIVLCCFFGFNAWAQQSVTGSVKDESGMGIFGATVLEKGTNNGVVTAEDGTFQISVSKDAMLVISFLGYQTQEVSSNQDHIEIVLVEGITLGEVQVVGSRSYNRSSADSPVAVDIIPIADVAATNGKVEVNQILQFAVPSFNATKQSGSDGADHIDPASLRGLGPDQTLVLINGKRRHQSSLVNVFGTRGRGNTGTDLNAIPASAIKRLEVLRDGASAQYGSDAIAGVINIVLNDNTDGVRGSLSYGGYSTRVGGDYQQQIFDTQDGWDTPVFNVNGTNRIDGKTKKYDGITKKLDLNYGTSLGDEGFFNVTTEFLSKDRTLRPSYEWREGYGTAAVEGFNVMINSAIKLGDQTELYAFGGRNFRDSDAYAFTRGSFANGDNRAVPSLYPNGFSPHITSIITDASVSAGVKHTMDSGWIVDFNNTYGKNLFHYFIKGTNNASLKDASPTEFDAGGHSLSMNTTGLDFSKYYKDQMEGVNLAFGLEFRSENFEIFAGEEGSYAIYDNNGTAITNPAIQSPATDSNGDTLSGGSQGFPGYSPANVVNAFRSNFGAYFDAEFNFTQDFLMDTAIRYEKYSDFGDNVSFKAAARLKASDNLNFRGSISTGFRAPSLAQIYYNLVFNNIVAGRSVRTLLSPNHSTVTKAFGIDTLKEETALNLSLGFTYTAGAFKATVDAYSISVNDRIILTDYFDASSLNMGVEAAQFFANGADTRTNGVDIVLDYKTTLGKGNLNLGLAGNMNQLDIKSINSGGLNEYAFFSPFSRAYLEAAAPKSKYTLSANYKIGDTNFLISATQFSQVELQDFQWVDSPATNAAEASALYASATDIYKAASVIDCSITQHFSNNTTFTLGANNLLNVYPTPQFDGWTDQGGFNDSVQMGADGMYVFGRLGFKF